MERPLPPKSLSSKLKTIVVEGQNIQELVDKFIPRMLKYADRFGLSQYADDLVQDVFIALLEESKKQHIQNPKAFLFGVLKNKVKVYCRERRKKNDIFSCLESAQLECQKATVKDSILIQELENEYQKKIERLNAIMDEHLNPEQRKILHLKFFESKSYKEISLTLNINEVTIRQKSSRAIKKIRALF